VESRGRSSGSNTAGAARRTAAGPTPFTYWYALVPYEEGNGAKERPVLVLRLAGAHAEVLKVTSRPKQGRTTWRRIDTSRWVRPGVRDGSWLQTDRVVTVPVVMFRRYLGTEENPHFRAELLRLHPART
jgi:mRNA-degrading endonuclease toxin of MazEF toxin-antitoxin module